MISSIWCLQVSILIVAVIDRSHGFQSPLRIVPRTSLKESVNGQDTNEDANIVASSDTKSELFNAFSALSDADQYDAVLTGLCAKILDDSQVTEEIVVQRLRDPTQLLGEMNGRRLQASPRSMMAMIDVSLMLVEHGTCLSSHDSFVSRQSRRRMPRSWHRR